MPGRGELRACRTRARGQVLPTGCSWHRPPPPSLALLSGLLLPDLRWLVSGLPAEGSSLTQVPGGPGPQGPRTPRSPSGAERRGKARVLPAAENGSFSRFEQRCCGWEEQSGCGIGWGGVRAPS